MKVAVIVYIAVIILAAVIAVVLLNHPAVRISAAPEPTPMPLILNNTKIKYAFDYFNYKPPGAVIMHPLLLKFPIVRSPMPYYLYNNSPINQYKYNLTVGNIRVAFDYWENATKGRVRFVQVGKSPQGIVINLVDASLGASSQIIGNDIITQTVVGEGSPTAYVFKDYSLVIGGEMALNPLYGGAENRVQIVHEIGHIMGFAHSSDPHSVMYYVNAYSQEITPDIIEALDILYKDIPAS